MSGKFKALGLGLLAATAVSVVGVVNASATSFGTFEFESNHTVIVGSENATHKSKFSLVGLAGNIECGKVAYTGTAQAELVAGVTVTPHYEECKTEGTATNVTIKHNGCEYTLKSSSEPHATWHVFCPSGKVIEIHHPNCTVTIPAQVANGVSYTKVVEGGKHALTVNLTIENITAYFHGGICIFTGTNHTATLKGSFTLKGTDTAGNATSITITA